MKFVIRFPKANAKTPRKTCWISIEERRTGVVIFVEGGVWCEWGGGG